VFKCYLRISGKIATSALYVIYLSFRNRGGVFTVWYALSPYIEQTIFIPLNLAEVRAGEAWEPSIKLMFFPSPGWGLSLSLSLSLWFFKG